MSKPLSPPPRYTPEEYLALERAAEFRSEYLDGYVYAMAEGSPEHAAITVNLSGEVFAQLRGTTCRAFSSDMKVRTSYDGLYAYPDLSVVCSEPIFHDENRDVLVNPRVIFEVLSPSTEAQDRGAKFLRYQTIESLTDYVLIAQDEPRLEHFVRQPNGGWLWQAVSGLDSSLRIVSINCTLSLAGVYDRITFLEGEQSGA